jgi:hypothetical protein
MSQANETTIAHPIPLDRQRRYGAAGAIAALIAAGALAGAFVISTLSSGPLTVPSPQSERLVDGWMPAAAAAGAAHLDRVQDGYLAGLVGARSDGDLVDGFLPGLVTTQSADALVDGWMATIPGRSAGPQDGWESSLTR